MLQTIQDKPAVQRALTRLAPVASGTVRLLEAPMASYVETILPLSLALIAGLAGFITLPKWAALVWLILFGADYAYVRLRRGTVMHQVVARIGEANAGLAGDLDTMIQHLTNGKNGKSRLNDATCRSLCVPLLRVIKRYTEVVRIPGRDVVLRVNLAVPQLDATGQAFALKVWCYDELHNNRRYSEMPVGFAGAPSAYTSGRIQIIDDIHAVENVFPGETRDYYSIVSIPVKAGGPAGPTLAVINIDASKPGVFTLGDVEGQIIPLAQAAINAIALAIVLRRQGERYAFHL